MIDKIPMTVRAALGMLLVFVVGIMAMFIALDYTVKSYIIDQSKDFLVKFIQVQIREHLTADDLLFSESDSARAAFEQYLKEVSLPETLQVSIWSKDAKVISSSNPALVGRRFPDDPEFQEAIRGKVEARIGAPSRSEDPDVGIEGDGEIFEIYIPVVFPDVVDPVGVIELYYDFAKVSQLISQMKFGLLVVLAVLILLILGFLWCLFNSQVAKPILALGGALKSFRVDQPFVKMGIYNISEIDSLVRSFNQMAVSLQDAYENLELKVEERTKSLNVAMEDLEKAQVRTEALLSSIGDGVVATDTVGRVIFINEVASKMIGWPIPEVIGKVWTDDLPLAVDEYDNPIPSEKRPIKIALLNGKTLTARFYYKRKDGSKFPVVITASPVLLGDRTIGAEIIFRDVTKEKEVEQAKTEFVSLASHQLRTPLSAMKWTIELLLEKKGMTKFERSTISDLAVSVERLIGLVNDLLSVSRMESGRAVGVKAPFVVLGAIKEAVKALTVIAKMRKQDLRIVSNDGSGSVLAIPMLFAQTIQNLVANAIYYSPRGARIDVSVERRERDYLISIHNTGSCIPKDEQGRIFEKFFRGSVAQRLKPEGSGLGLFIAKAAVEANGGKIWVESGESEGTTFLFTVPIAK